MHRYLPDDFTLMLDIIHGVEHLWAAGTVLYGETDLNARGVGQGADLDILSSRTARVIDRLEDTACGLSPTSQSWPPRMPTSPFQPGVNSPTLAV